MAWSRCMVRCDVINKGQLVFLVFTVRFLVFVAADGQWQPWTVCLLTGL